MNRVVVAIAIASFAACTGDLDEPWELDHDRIVAVRATPPSIATGDTAKLDALIGKKGDKLRVAKPELAIVVTPTSLDGAVTFDGSDWVVRVPGEDQLAAARAELKLAAGAPVPLQVGVSYENRSLYAVKTIRLGAGGENPALASLMINGAPATDDPIVISKLAEVPLSLDVTDEDYDVTWLTSCGTMHDFDLPSAYITVEEEDSTEGELAVVLRDASGGVAWRAWSIRAE